MISIRVATADDAHRLWEIEEASFDHPWTEEMILDCIWGNETITTWAAEEDGKIVAFMIASFLPQLDAEIYDIAVDPAYRRRGIGKGLIDYLIGQAQCAMVEDIFLEVRRRNEGAKALYTLMGFKEYSVREKYYDDGDDAILMRFEVK